MFKKKIKEFYKYSAGLGPRTSKGTGVGGPGHLLGVGVKQWVRFALGEFIGSLGG